MVVEKDLDKETITKQEENISKVNDYQREEELTGKEGEEMKARIEDQEKELRELRAKLEDQRELEERLDKSDETVKKILEMMTEKMAEVTNVIDQYKEENDELKEKCEAGFKELKEELRKNNEF